MRKKSLREEGWWSCAFGLLDFVSEAEVIRDHGNELGVCGLAAIVLNGVPEVGIEGIHVPAIPSYLDGMTDGALHAGGCGLILFCDRWVEDLGNRVDHVAVLYRHQNGGAEILISLNVSGHADLVDDLGDLRFNVGRLYRLAGQSGAAVTVAENGLDMFAQTADVVGP